FTLTSALASSSSFTTATWPFSAARYSAVPPRLSFAFDVCLGLQQQLHHRLTPVLDRHIHRRHSIFILHFDVCLGVQQQLDDPSALLLSRNRQRRPPIMVLYLNISSLP